MSYLNFKPNKQDIPMTLKRDIFGKEFKISMIIPTCYLPDAKVKKAKLKDNKTIARFNKNPMLIQYSHGKNSQMKLLKTMADKKILLGSLNINDMSLQEQLDSITLENCLKLFGKIVLDCELSQRTNDRFLGSIHTDLTIFPFMNKYYLGKKIFNKFETEHILSVLYERNSKVYQSSLKSGKFYMKDQNYFREFNFDFSEEDSLRRISDKIHAELEDWKLPVDTSGVVQAKQEIIKTLNVGDGYVGVTSSNVENLRKKKKPKCFQYKDSDSQEEKFSQPFNRGTSKFKYIIEDNKDSIIAGYKRNYVEGLIKESEFFKGK